MRLRVQITGMEKITEVLHGLPDRLGNGIVRSALRDGAKVGKEIARHEIQASLSATEQPAPHLADTLRIKAMKRDRSKKGRIGFVVITGRRDELAITKAEQGVLDRRRRIREGLRDVAKKLGKKYRAPTFAKLGPGYYPAHIEFGYIDEHGNHVPANPYMKRALEQARPIVTAAVGESIARRLKDAVGLDKDASDEALTEEVEVEAD